MIERWPLTRHDAFASGKDGSTCAVSSFAPAEKFSLFVAISSRKGISPCVVSSFVPADPFPTLFDHGPSFVKVWTASPTHHTQNPDQVRTFVTHRDLSVGR